MPDLNPDAPVDVDAESPEPPSKKNKVQSSLLSTLERGFTKEENHKAVRQQVMCSVLNGWSYNCQESKYFTAWVTSLRSNYIPPSRKMFGKLEEELYSTVKEKVIDQLQRSKRVTIAWDSWTAHTHIYPPWHLWR